MGFLSELGDAWKHGKLPDEPSPRRCDVPKPAKAKTVRPTPIKFGYYLDRKTGKPGTPLLWHGERHAILHGLARAGKQTRMLTELAMTSRGRSFFWVDSKGTITSTCGDEIARHSKLQVISPYPVHNIKGVGFNALLRFDADSDSSFSDARAIVDAIFDRYEGGTGAHFTDGGSQIVAAFVMFEVQLAKAEHRTPSLVNVVRKLMEPDKFEPLRDAEGKEIRGPKGGVIEEQTQGLRVTVKRMIKEGGPLISLVASRFMREAGKDELAGIHSTAVTQLTPFLDPCIERDLSVTDGADLTKLRDECTTVLVVLPPDKLDEQRRWLKVLLSCAIRGHFRPGKYSTLFVLDEFRATVGNLPVLVKNWAVVPEYGMQFLPIVQSLEHLRACWGDEWEGMVSQAGIVATIGPAGDRLSCEWMSERSGDTTRAQAGYNASSGTANGATYNAGSASSPNGNTNNEGGGDSANSNSGDGYGVQLVKRRYLLPQDFRSLRPGEGRIWVAGEGRLSIPFYAPNFWKLRAPWAARVKPNPLTPG
ncbi:type IV secretory system conjugative DNA transfer family protein [Acidisphaera sp. S103]|uniref:type IV secretory system conjugative DNA transfer family protein n=1 Tax=Acidisphaera sp. S103 TaxID=1747223 RepID=UPI00131DDC83|nr:type IV secretory system conjugative DNA transfer family protein [Acidisphaera sp. S103]